MSELERKNTLGFTSYIWLELHQKATLFFVVEDYVKLHFDISAYSPQVVKLIFALDINPDDVDVVLKLRSRYAWNRKVIELFGKIGYETFLAADEKEALRLMCESYLNEILMIPTLKGMKKVFFDAQKLHEDLKMLFEEKHWI
jgi:hypothetical protein